MSVFGFSTGGASSSGPSRMFGAHPFKNYRDHDGGPRAWIEEFVDSIGSWFDIIEHRFISPAARSQLLDTSRTDSDVACAAMATATKPPLGSVFTDTVLDVLCYIAGVPTPVDTNLTVAQKQALAAIGWDLLRTKGNRLAILRMIAAMTDGVVQGWTVPPWQFGAMVPDGAPSPGYGSWVPASGLVATERPWLFAAISRYCAEKIFPAWGTFGVGYSQFRAGFSAVGEPTYPSGSRLNILAREHFDAWSGSLPTGWTNSGTTYVKEGTSATANLGANLNFEFTSSLCVLDLSTAPAPAGTVVFVSQSALSINNQLEHRVEVDYSYTNPASVYQLCLTISDTVNSKSWDPVTGSWVTLATPIPLPPTATLGTRTRYATDFTPLEGAGRFSIQLHVTSDGTSSTQQKYGLFRVGFYEKHSHTVELAATGERTLWLPLYDSQGWTTYANAGTIPVVESRNYNRSTLAAFLPDPGTGIDRAVFDYHPALSGRAYRSNATWTNLLKGSNDFRLAGTDWDLTNCTVANTSSGPVTEVGAGVYTAKRLTASASPAQIDQLNVVADPSSKSYIAGLWVKTINSNTTTPAGTVTITSGSTTVTGSGTSFASTWIGRTITCGSVSGVIAGVGSGTSLTLLAAATASASGAFTVSTTDITIRLTSDTTAFEYVHEVPASQGWTLLPIPAVTFGAGDTDPLYLSVLPPQVHPTAQVEVFGAYVYDVTGKTGVLYPPVCLTNTASTGTVAETSLVAQVSGACKHPLTLRGMFSVASGMLILKIVPMFDGPSQPAAVIFSAGAAASSANNIALVVTGGELQAQVWDNGGTKRHAALTLITSDTPTATGQMTWRRDEEILVQFRWSGTTGIDLSAGNGVASFTGSLPWTTSDASLTGIGIGCVHDGTAPVGGFMFDGLIRDVEVLQIGAPS